MSFFEGGKVPLIGVEEQVLVNIVGSGLINVGREQLSGIVGQVFQGSGQSFLAGPGQTVLNNASQGILNFGLNAILGEELAGQFGVDLVNGDNLLASIITPQVTKDVSALINQSISDTLADAGPFGPVLSDVAGTLAQGAFDSLLGAVGLGGGEAAGVGATSITGPTQRFPGGSSDQPPAEYAGGSAYTLGNGGPDVVFSLAPANQGVQLFGQENALFDPKVASKFPVTDFTTNPPPNYSAVFDAAQTSKVAEMFPGLTLPDEKTLKSYWDPTVTGETLYSSGNYSFYTAQPGWTFICAPEDISWDLANASSRIDMFGTNNPPVVAGTKGMRDLKIGNALVEGFSRGVSVEGKVRALENLMNYTANASDGFVGVPVYQFWANSKSYGYSDDLQSNGYFIIESVSVKEAMRDLAGQTTRAYVDISLKQVPEYQVFNGRDIAGKVTTAARSALVDQAQVNAIKATQGASVKKQAEQSKRRSGAGVPTSSKPANTPPPSTQTRPKVKAADLNKTPDAITFP